MAEHAVLRQRNYDAAIQHYKEALTFDANDEVGDHKSIECCLLCLDVHFIIKHEIMLLRIINQHIMYHSQLNTNRLHCAL